MYNIDNIERIINSLHHSINHVYAYYLFFLRKLFPMKFPAKEKKKRIDILFFFLEKSLVTSNPNCYFCLQLFHEAFTRYKQA